MKLVPEGHPGFNKEAQTQDLAYLDEIGPAVCTVIRQIKNHDDEHLIVIARDGDTSTVTAFQKTNWLSLLREENASEPNSIVQSLIDRASQPPSNPRATWIVILGGAQGIRLISAVVVADLPETREKNA